jgi:hypothetical protein
MTIDLKVGIKDFVVVSTGEKSGTHTAQKIILRKLKYSKKELVENRMVLQTEIKPNKKLLYLTKSNKSEKCFSAQTLFQTCY